MHVDDVYEGCLDMATFGHAVVGPVTDDRPWVINPLTYDPTCPAACADAEVKGVDPCCLSDELECALPLL